MSYGNKIKLGGDNMSGQRQPIELVIANGKKSHKGRNPSGEVDISSIKNIELRLQASVNENATASVVWTLS